MTTYDINIASCHRLPEPDLDQAPLTRALDDAGLRARICDWRDPGVDWSQGRLTLIRSTWDYFHDRERFVRWAEHVGEVSELHNPVEIVRWNSHKSYLVDLAARGLPVIPTVLVERGSARALADVREEHGWGRVVIKPAVSAASFETHVVDEEIDDSAAFTRLVAERDVLVQPYVDGVDRYGERSLIVIDGALTHCVKKHPRFAGENEHVTGPHPASDAERELATEVLGSIDELDAPLLYARVDMVPDDAGQPMLAELEVIEPSLFFRFGEEALRRMVEGLRARLR